MRTAPLALLLLSLLGSPALACTNIYGIPGECRMQVHEVDTASSASQRSAPRRLLDEFMVGRWTYRAAIPSPGGETLVLHREAGLRIRRGERVVDLDLDLMAHNPRGLCFAPSGQEAALWAPASEGQPLKRVALLDLSRLDPVPEPQIVYTPPEGFLPYGLCWSPSGDALFVVGVWGVSDDRPAQGAVVRVERRGWRARELYRSAGPIDFVSAPPARPGVSAPFQLLLGDVRGLATLDPLNGRRAAISALPSLGLHNLEWNPNPDLCELVLFFRNPTCAPDGRRYSGVYRLDLTSQRWDRPPELEELYPRRDVHTLYYSPQGTYLSWASNEALHLRPTLGEADQAEVLQWLDAEGEPRRVRGFAWAPDERALAVAVEDEVWIERLEDPARRYCVARFESGFCADPQWLDADTLVVTSFDAALKDTALRNTRPVLRVPGPPPLSAPVPPAPQPAARPRRPRPVLASFATAPSDLALPRAAPFVGLLAASALLLALVARAYPSA